jgi:hypothetical protein
MELRAGLYILRPFVGAIVVALVSGSLQSRFDVRVLCLTVFTAHVIATATLLFVISVIGTTPNFVGMLHTIQAQTKV